MCPSHAQDSEIVRGIKNMLVSGTLPVNALSKAVAAPGVKPLMSVFLPFTSWPTLAVWSPGSWRSALSTCFSLPQPPWP